MRRGEARCGEVFIYHIYEERRGMVWSGIVWCGGAGLGLVGYGKVW